MIRINLLPTKKQRAASSGRSLVFLALAVVIVEIIGIGVLHASRSSKRTDLVRANDEIRTRIGGIKREISDHGAIRAEIGHIQRRDEVIEQLKAARTGPVLTLMELAGILSPGGGPRVSRDLLEQMRRDNPLTAPNARWDPRRLWITTFNEDQRKVKFEGQARGHDDVAEFLRRLNVSPYFDEVRLVKTQSAVNNDLHLELVQFEIECTARYE
jgi:type IV pilus assembly protein PilN